MFCVADSPGRLGKRSSLKVNWRDRFRRWNAPWTQPPGSQWKSLLHQSSQCRWTIGVDFTVEVIMVVHVTIPCPPCSQREETSLS